MNPIEFTMSYFQLDPSDDFVWNRADLLEFLVKNQGNAIIINTHFEGCSLAENGVYDLLDLFEFPSVTIQTANIFEQHPRYQIEYLRPLHFFNVPKETDYTEYHYWNRRHVFAGLYYRASWHRIGLFTHLYANYRDKSSVSFRQNPHNEDSRKFFNIQKLFEIDPQSVTNFLSIRQDLPIRIEEHDTHRVGAGTIEISNGLAEYYPDFLIEIVSETFVNGRTFFPTEKTVRPMLLKKPFIIMGPKCYLIHLRQLGFKTFHEFWDEDYDGFNPRHRYMRILKLIDDLAKKTPEELDDMYKRMQPILDHNYNLLITQTYGTQLEYVE